MSHAGSRTMSLLPQPYTLLLLPMFTFLSRVSCTSIWLVKHKSYMKLGFLVIWERGFSVPEKLRVRVALVIIICSSSLHFVSERLENHNRPRKVTTLYLIFLLPRDQWEDRHNLRKVIVRTNDPHP